MRFTIERIRTLVLAAGVLLIVVLAVFLVRGKWKLPFNRRDIPKRLGIDIQQEANGVTYTQAHGGHTIFKIHASRVVQLRNQHATLHDVVIDLYGQNGASVDQIKGDEFEYDQKNEIATASGPVEITLTRPAVAPEPGSGAKARARQASASGTGNEIHVKTSGLIFNQQTGVASTSQHVDFSSVQGSGSAMGASFSSDNGLLILESAVELTTRQDASPVKLYADHAEFDRNAELGHLRGATAETRDEKAWAAQAQIAFRDDGSVERVDASGGFTVSTSAGSRLAAPRGSMEFNQDSQPLHATFEGGVTIGSINGGRTINGSSPTMTLEFNSDGDLRHAHLERGVEMHSLEQGQQVENGRTVPVEISRTWHSPGADVDFRQDGAGHVEPSLVRGTGGVVVTGETRTADKPPVPSRLAADEVTGIFGSNSALTSMTGVGHASLEETTATGARDMASGDRLQAQFTPAGVSGESKQPAASPQAAQIQSAELEGHVVLVQQLAAMQRAKPQPPLRATAGHAVYEAAGEWLHLTMSPRVENGGMQLTADKLDVSQESGSAFAHGNVKATWLNNGAVAGDQNAGGANTAALGGNGPAHAIAAEAEMRQASGATAGGEVTFRGHARLWQQANSIAGPLIVIDRQKQTLIAKASNPAEPVVAVMLSAGAQPSNSGSEQNGRTAAPIVVRVRGGDFWFSQTERKAVMRAAPLPVVTALSGTLESTSQQVELFLAPAGAARPAAADTTPAQVERMNALGHVVLTSQGRRGTGEKLTYTSQSGDYVLTGTVPAPPRLTDPQRGSVTGAALIFNSRNDSVSIEGGGHETTTETTAPK